MAKHTIVAIDDDPVVLKIIEQTVCADNYNIICFQNPVEAVKEIKTIQPKAIILDRVMDEMDGNDVINALQNDDYTRDIPIMMLTSLSDVSAITASLGLGARDYIVKPFDKENFMIRLKKLIGKS